MRHLDLPDSAFREGALQAGLPQALIEMQSEYYAAVRQGVVDILAPDVEALLGRPPGSFLSWAEAHKSAFV